MGGKLQLITLKYFDANDATENEQKRLPCFFCLNLNMPEHFISKLNKFNRISNQNLPREKSKNKIQMKIKLSFQTNSKQTRNCFYLLFQTFLTADVCFRNANNKSETNKLLQIRENNSLNTRCIFHK